jgi:lipopolysaccharide export system protein LptC
MKPIHWIILAIIVIAVIAFIVYQNQKKKKIPAPQKGNAEGWLLHNYKILVNKGDLKKAHNFSDAMNNFDEAVKKVESLSGCTRIR